MLQYHSVYNNCRYNIKRNVMYGRQAKAGKLAWSKLLKVEKLDCVAKKDSNDFCNHITHTQAQTREFY